MGGGILLALSAISLNAIELKYACEDNGGNCSITKHYTIITNTDFFTLNKDNGSSIIFYDKGIVDTFINYGEIDTTISFSKGEIKHITNYGTMQGISVSYDDHNNHIVTIANRGVIKPLEGKYHFNTISIHIANYAMLLSESADAFNGFNGTNPITNSHLVLNSVKSISFLDKNSKIILDFDENFEFGKGYSLNKLVVDDKGSSQLSVDLSHLTTKSSLYKLTQNGDNFIVSLDAPNSEIGILNKSNIRTMNNFMILSNSMIYPRKYSKSQNLGRKNSKNILSLRDLPTANRGNPKDLRAKRSNHPQNSAESKPYYFILTPFVNHNLFFESGRYNLSGFDYGFLTAFSARVAESNSLGAHFMMSYGSLGDSSDKNFHISNLNLNLGLNYKLDLIWDSYVKARGDFFYFLNQVKTLTMINAIKPNNLGFGVSVSYGKDFDFKQGGVLGIEVGLDYKALKSSNVELHDDTYQKQLYNLIYADLGLSYNKYFGSFGLNANLGIKGNITANKLSKSKIILNNFNRSVDMILDNDKVLGYANVALSYVLNHRNFDMEFSLAYYGNYGDRMISNGGGFEWRVGW